MIIISACASQVSVLASSALKQAVSEEDSTIRLPSALQQPQPEASLGAMDSMASSTNSGWQSDIESLPDKQSRERSAALEETSNKKPGEQPIFDLICLEESQDAIQPLGQFQSHLDTNPFGEPDAFPQSQHGNSLFRFDAKSTITCEDLAFSDSDAWDEVVQNGPMASPVVADNDAEAEQLDSVLEASSGTVSTESVCWNQLIDGLADNSKNASAGRMTTSRSSSMTRDPDVSQSTLSPFCEDSVGSGPMLDVDSLQTGSHVLSKRMSRVQSLRVKSQKHLEEMLAANLRIFDRSTSAAAHPGSVPWILPRNAKPNIPPQQKTA